MRSNKPPRSAYAGDSSDKDARSAPGQPQQATPSHSRGDLRWSLCGVTGFLMAIAAVA